MRLQTLAGPLAWALPFVLVGVPATLMGGTLPAAVRALGPADPSVGRATGLLYAVNTAGAIVGTLARAVRPRAGPRRPRHAASPLASSASRSPPALSGSTGASHEDAAPQAEARRRRTPPDARLALALYAVAGAVALGYEVVWSELLVQFLSTRAHAFAIMLATYLGGLAIGSWLFSRAGGPQPRIRGACSAS